MNADMNRGEWLLQFIKLVNGQREAAKRLGVARTTLQRGLNSGGEPSAAVLEAIKAYWEENGTGFEHLENTTEENTGGGTKNGTRQAPDIIASNIAGATDDSHDHADGADTHTDVESGNEDDAEGAMHVPQTEESEEGLLARIEGATSSEMLAELMGTPVLAELPLGDARVAASALVRGWQWQRDTPPPGCHGAVLQYLHTKEPVRFADEAVKRIAFAPPTEEFECGWAAAELRYGITPQQRQQRYAVVTHKGRGDLIGLRRTTLVPAAPYPDERWFFGSDGEVVDWEWQRSSGEIIAHRRYLISLLAGYREHYQRRREMTPYLLEIQNEILREEIRMCGTLHELTMGGKEAGQRLWSAPVRLGIETRSREKRIATNEVYIAEYKRRQRRGKWLLRLPKLPGLMVRRLIAEMRYGLADYASVDESTQRVRVRERVLPTLHEWDDAEKDSRRVKFLKWLFYREEWRLGRGAPRVCGLEKWQATTPMNSEAYRRYWRPHEFEEGYKPPVRPEEPPKSGLIGRTRERVGNWLS